jgi:hypothetical protein
MRYAEIFVERKDIAVMPYDRMFTNNEYKRYMQEMIEKSQNVLKQTSKTLRKEVCPRVQVKDLSKVNHISPSAFIFLSICSLPDLLLNVFCNSFPSLSDNYRVNGF